MRVAKCLQLAALLAAALVAGPLVSTPAFADHDGDVKNCFSGDDNRTGERIGSCTRIIKSGKLNRRDLAGAYNWRGEAYRIQKQYDLALADYAKSIEINPDSVYPFANRAEVYRMQGKFDLVIKDTTQAISIDPALNASYAIRGMAYEKTGDTERARADFNKALELPVKGNDGPWAQDIARNHLQSLGGGTNSGQNARGGTRPGGNILMNDNNEQNAPGNEPNAPGGTTSSDNPIMNR